MKATPLSNKIKMQREWGMISELPMTQGARVPMELQWEVEEGNQDPL